MDRREAETAARPALACLPARGMLGAAALAAPALAQKIANLALPAATPTVR